MASGRSRDLARVLLAQRARRRVARVHERRLAALDALLVHAVELLDRVVHLAADLDDVGRVVVGEAVGHVVEREQLLGDGLPHRAGAAGGADREHAVAVHAVDGGAVDLQLARPPDRRCRRAGRAAPGRPTPAGRPRRRRCRATASPRGARTAGRPRRAATRPAGWASRASAARGTRPRSPRARAASASNSASGIARSDST